jgi:hypothetical protein
MNNFAAYVSVCVSHRPQNYVPQLGIYIMASEPISTSYLIGNITASQIAEQPQGYCSVT